jgi:hypothetical protein
LSETLAQVLAGEAKALFVALTHAIAIKKMAYSCCVSLFDRTGRSATGTARQKPNGVVAKGEIRANDLMGSLKGKTIADLVAEFHAGKAYVNVHSKAHPEGEIRGPIE